MIAVLEDDAGRTAEMRRVLAVKVPASDVWFAADAPAMIAWLRENLQIVALMSLDHDLLSLEKDADPGSGRVVADYLAGHRPTCPVLIHSSNGFAADGMQFTLEAAGWSVRRVFPMRDIEWIDQEWIDAVLEALEQ